MVAPSQNTEEILHCDFIASVINLNVITIEIECMIFIVEDLSRVHIPGVAGDVISKHENDVIVGDT
jgi:hypothetical protein